MPARARMTWTDGVLGPSLLMMLACSGPSDAGDDTGTGTEVDADSGSMSVSVADSLDSDPDGSTSTGADANLPPVAVDDALQAWLSATVSLAPLANDTDPDDGIDVASVSITTPPLRGTATVESDGTVTYVHDGSAERSDSMTYVVADLAGLVSTPATIELTVSGPIMLGGTTWATSESPELPATAAADGDPTTRWESTASARGGHVLELDLQGWHRLSEVTAELGPGEGAAADPDFVLQYWDGCWQTFAGGEFHGTAAESETIAVQDVVTPRIRYMCTTLGGTCTLRELTALGVPDVPPATPIECATGELAPVLHPDYGYAVFLPVDYDRTGTWPVIASYHGVGGTVLTGDYTAVVATPEGVPRRIALEPAFAASLGAIVIAPHCRAPGGSGTCWFDPDAMERMFVHALRDWNIDPDRVSVVGLSGGAIRGWDLLIRQREQIAAFVPIASDYYGEYIDFGPSPDFDPLPPPDGRHFCDLIDVPISAYHGTVDSVVNYNGAHATPVLDDWMNSRCDATSDVFEFDPTDFPNRGHDIWDDVFADDALYGWLLAKRVSDRPFP